MMKKGATLLNVSRGGLVNSDALIAGLENGKLGGVGMDVYENEGGLTDSWSSRCEWVCGPGVAVQTSYTFNTPRVAENE
jgi:lactate dehydrogenase-like 2-hydroxyacid dehydrogenase